MLRMKCLWNIQMEILGVKIQASEQREAVKVGDIEEI